MNGDPIDSLQVDNSIPSHQELQIVDKLFKEEPATMGKIFGEIKSVVVVAILYIFFSLPAVDGAIHKCLPVTENSWMILVGVKALVFMVIYYVIQNFWLMKKEQ